MLTAALTADRYGAANISCQGAADGRIATAIAGGTPPYTLAWNTGATQATLEELEVGTYTLTITDARGCAAIESVELVEPAPLLLRATGTDPDCTGPQTGALAAVATGGSGPYQFDLGAGSFETATERAMLEGGPYMVRVRDSNGCTADTSLVLIAPVYPELKHAPLIELALGDSVRLRRSATSIRSNCAGRVPNT